MNGPRAADCRTEGTDAESGCEMSESALRTAGFGLNNVMSVREMVAAAGGIEAGTRRYV